MLIPTDEGAKITISFARGNLIPGIGSRMKES